MRIDRILIVGLGSIGKRHLRLARQLFPRADIRVLRHKRTNEVPEYSNGIFFSIEEACAFFPMVAVIAGPATLHIHYAQALAGIGVHLLIEKPLSATLNGVTKLLEICKKHNVVLLTGYNLRFLPSLQHFRDLLSEGAIGRILSIRTEVGQYLPSWRTESDYRKGVSARSELGGGVLLELSHELDYLRWIFGEIEWVKATLCRQSDLDIDVEDSAHLVLGFVSDSNRKQLIGTLNMDFIRHDSSRVCTAICEKGTLRWNGLIGEVMLYEEGVGWRECFIKQHESDDSYQAEWLNFIAAIADHKNPLITGEDGLKVLQIIEAAKISSISHGIRVMVENAQVKMSVI